MPVLILLYTSHVRASSRNGSSLGPAAALFSGTTASFLRKTSQQHSRTSWLSSQTKEGLAPPSSILSISLWSHWRTSSCSAHVQLHRPHSLLSSCLSVDILFTFFHCLLLITIFSPLELVLWNICQITCLHVSCLSLLLKHIHRRKYKWKRRRLHRFRWSKNRRLQKHEGHLSEWPF